MVDPASVGSALTSIKTAIDIAKLIRASTTTLEQAEVKLKLAELIESLADAKLEVVEIQEQLAAKDEQIRVLKDAFEAKNSLLRKGDAFYRTNASGEPEGNPLCLRCWEVDHLQRPLVDDGNNYRLRKCPACSQTYPKHMAGRIGET